MVLYLALVPLICLSVLGGLAVWQEHDARADEVTLSESDSGDEDVPASAYSDVLAAAKSEAEAFASIDHGDLDAGIAKVQEGATGKFKKQYEKSAKGLRKMMQQNKSKMTSEIISAGVVSMTEYSATVLVATKGKVSNTKTKGKPVERNFRLKLDLTRVKGTWLTNNLEFVG